VLPLDDSSALEQATIERPTDEPLRERYIYYPETAAVPEGVAVNTRGRSYKILANGEITDPNCSGMIFAHGSRFGGHALFIKDKKLYYVYHFLGIKPEQQFISPALNPGKYILGMEFIREKVGQNKESLGTTKLFVNDKVVAEGPMRAQVGSLRFVVTVSASDMIVVMLSAKNINRLESSREEKSKASESLSKKHST
jgi:arylsulfatase